MALIPLSITSHKYCRRKPDANKSDRGCTKKYTNINESALHFIGYHLWS